MSFSVVFLKSAEQDVKDLTRYGVEKLGKEAWQATLGRLRDSIYILQTQPHAGNRTNNNRKNCTFNDASKGGSFALFLASPQH